MYKRKRYVTFREQKCLQIIKVVKIAIIFTAFMLLVALIIQWVVEMSIIQGINAGSR